MDRIMNRVSNRLVNPVNMVTSPGFVGEGKGRDALPYIGNPISDAPDRLGDTGSKGSPRKTRDTGSMQDKPAASQTPATCSLPEVPAAILTLAHCVFLLEDEIQFTNSSLFAK